MFIGGFMYTKKIVVAAVLFSFFCLCGLFANDNTSDESESNDEFIYGWQTKGTFTVNFFEIQNQSKSTNTQTMDNIENSINYGEAFLFSSRNYGEYTLLFHLKNGGKIEIKCFQDKGITVASLFQDYESYPEDTVRNETPVHRQYIERIKISGYGTLKEFDKNSRLIKEKKYDSIKGTVTVQVIGEGSARNNMAYTFNGEGVYELLLNSISESERIIISNKINSPY
jgi:hypothetical protein